MRFLRVLILVSPSFITVSHFSSTAAFQTTVTDVTQQLQQRSLIRQKKDTIFKYRAAPVPIASSARKNHRHLWSTSRTSTDADLQSLLPIDTATGESSKRTKVKALGKKVLKKRPIRITLIKSTAFLAGIANVFCVKRHSCYANMMTGNTIKCATAVSQLCLADTIFYALLITSYLVGFGAYRVADQTVTINYNNNNNKEAEESNQSRPPTTPAIIAPIVFGLFAVYDVLWAASTSHQRWLISLLAIGSGMINSASAESTGVVTGMMTGNLQRIANYAVDTILHQIFHRRGKNDGDSENINDTSSYSFPKPSSERQAGVRTSLKIIAFFVSGIVAASVGMRRHTALASTLVLNGAGGFTMLGGAYAVLLCLYSFPSGALNQLSFKKKFQVPIPLPTAAAPTPPCELDLYETECVVDEYYEEQEDDFTAKDIDDSIVSSPFS
mmetsp:Transcript_35266/g.42543  ORF Transcript_35266/g.42543 Transcript_35266/m.42543 type:complete len:441 (+) Transcript_35266:113-1435(+)